MFSRILPSPSVLSTGAASARAQAAFTASRFNSTRKYSSTMHDNDPETLEVEKRRNLSNSQHKTSTPHKHAPGWNEHLASSSEASVKADKSTESAADLQNNTVDYLKTRYSPDDNTADSTTALYSRDEVSGPLSGAEGHEDSTANNRQTISKKTVHKETVEVVQDSHMHPTESEQNVKADRGEA